MADQDCVWEPIDIEAIRTGKLKSMLPELYELADCIENNDWHDQKSVFDHTLDVLAKLAYEKKHLPKALKAYFETRVGTHSKGELVDLALLLHDFGKLETMEMANGRTTTKGHEEAGAVKVRPILTRLGLDGTETDYVARLIRCHGQANGLLNRYDDPDFGKLFEAYKNENAPQLLELILMATCDTEGSQLLQSHPENYAFRIEFFRKILNSPDRKS